MQKAEPNDQGEWKCPICLQINKGGLPGPLLFRDNVTSFILIRIRFILWIYIAADFKKSKNIISGDNRPTKISRMNGRTPCQYGIRCYRKNPLHKKEFSHPGDPDYPNQVQQIQQQPPPPVLFNANFVNRPMLFGGGGLFNNYNNNNRVASDSDESDESDNSDNSDESDSNESDETRSLDDDNTTTEDEDSSESERDPLKEENDKEKKSENEINGCYLQPLLYGEFSKLISKYLDINSLIKLIISCNKAKESYDKVEIWKEIYYNYIPNTTVDCYYNVLHNDLNTFKMMMKFIYRNIKRDNQLPVYFEKDCNVIKKNNKISKNKMKCLNKSKYILIGALKEIDNNNNNNNNVMEIENESDNDNEEEDSSNENKKVNLNCLLEKYHNKYNDFEYFDGGCYGRYDLDISKTASNNISELLKWFSKLKYFYLKNGEEQSIMESGNEYPNLLYFGIESCGICRELLNGILLNKYENLIELELWLGCEERGNNTKINDLNPLLNENEKYFPSLKILRIRNSEKMNEILNEILKSKIMKVLNEIDISYGILKDELLENLLNLLKFESIRCVIIHKHMIKRDKMNELKDRYKEKNVELIEDSISKCDDDDDSNDCIAIDE